MALLFQILVNLNSNPKSWLTLLKKKKKKTSFYAKSGPVGRTEVIKCRLFVLQGRIPYGRAVSTEQRWQDLASLLSLQNGQGEGGPGAFGHPFPPSATHQPHPNYGYDVAPTSAAQPPPRSVVLHNATLAPPIGDLNSSAAYQGLSMGSAVATSMSLNINSSEPMGDSAPPSACKMEAPHDMGLFYQVWKPREMLDPRKGKDPFNGVHQRNCINTPKVVR